MNLYTPTIQVAGNEESVTLFPILALNAAFAKAKVLCNPAHGINPRNIESISVRKVSNRN